jgi:predicted DNA-binding transcriptional regulator YafY
VATWFNYRGRTFRLSRITKVQEIESRIRAVDTNGGPLDVLADLHDMDHVYSPEESQQLETIHPTVVDAAESWSLKHGDS